MIEFALEYARQTLEQEDQELAAARAEAKRCRKRAQELVRSIGPG